MKLRIASSHIGCRARSKGGRFFAAGLVLMLLLSAAARAVETATPLEFYVATTGSDQNPGTQAEPFATPAAARDAVRKSIVEGLHSSIVVYFRQGTYELTEPLLLGPQDSGTEQYSITYAAYPGEKPVFSGGRNITGWKQGDGKVWTTQIPEAADGKWYFRQLVVNDRRAIRARTPNLDSNTPFYTLTGATLSSDMQHWELKLAPGQVANWKNISDVEVVVLGVWEMTQKRLESVDPATGTVVLAPPHVKSYSNVQPVAGMYCYFENARAMLDSPGEWYLDRATGVLSYWPRPGENMPGAEAVAPRLTRLMEIKGTEEQPVRNLHFTGIEFSHTDTVLPAQGYMGAGSCFYRVNDQGSSQDKCQRVEEAIHCEFIKGCSFEGCEISHLDGSGVLLLKGCSDNLIEGNHIFDLGANGIVIGNYIDSPIVADRNQSNTIANNHIHDCGIVYHAGLGVLVCHGVNTSILHNLVHDMPYIGISATAEPNTNATSATGNIIAYNHVHHVLNLLTDAGGIYVYGYQPKSAIRGNLIHDIRRDPKFTPFYNQCGIYLDDGCKGFVVESNVIFHVDKPISHNMDVKDDWNLLIANSLDVDPWHPGFPRAVADNAGPEAAFRKRFLGH